MKVSDLFSTEAEPILNEWMKSFTSLDDLFLAMPHLYAKLESQSIEGIIEDGTVLSGPVHIGRGAVVHAQAIIHGPSIIGPDTIINSHTEIQAGCFIGSKCVIGHSCSLVQSMVMNNTKIGAGAFIRNSVIGSGSVVGPGAALGSVEFDQASSPIAHASSTLGAVLGDYAVVGANSTIKSGTIIGSRTVVGEGVVASGIYESNQTVTLIPALEIKARHRDS
jgi:UDP-N-acetylglucosamine diphosphorylase / glucose-1-phosphate thymidylyltransferase / UDP-N-acetylgalactosamine diphosphorylase / glucosamine-1-phosphate N-acetyltransferase / galactosamine-1-phosphate N-acetyltransferase